MPAHAHTQQRSMWLRKRHHEGTQCDRAVTRSCETDRLSETAVLLVATVTRLDARTVRRRWERRPNLVRDADTASFTLDPGDREQVPDRQPWLPFDRPTRYVALRAAGTPATHSEQRRAHKRLRARDAIPTARSSRTLSNTTRSNCASSTLLASAHPASSSPRRRRPPRHTPSSAA